MSASPSPHLHKIPPTHPKSHMEARIFFPFLILMFSFYKHDMYRNSTQTNMFIFSHIRIQLFFKMSFKQSAWASHIRTTMHFVVLLIKSTSDLVRYVLSLFLYTSSTSLGREFPACIRSSLCCRFWCANASLVPLVRACVCVCLRFTWHLHVVGVCFEADSSRLSCDIYTGKKNTTWQPVKWEVKGQRGLCGQKGVGGSSRVGLGRVSRSCTCPFFFFNFNDSYR